MPRDTHECAWRDTVLDEADKAQLVLRLDDVTAWAETPEDFAQFRYLRDRLCDSFREAHPADATLRERWQAID